MLLCGDGDTLIQFLVALVFADLPSISLPLLSTHSFSMIIYTASERTTSDPNPSNTLSQLDSTPLIPNHNYYYRFASAGYNDDLFEVVSALHPVTAKWKEIGVALRLAPPDLDTIEKDNRDSDTCLNKTVGLWLMQNYNTERFGEPSWSVLADAVANSAGGKYPALADTIRSRGDFLLSPCADIL